MDTVLEIEKNRVSGGLVDQLTFVGLPTKSSARELSGSNEELFKGIVSILNSLLLKAIDAQTSEEFVAARSAVFGDIWKTMRAMSNLARVVIPARTLERLSWEAFAELEADLMEQGLKRFGELAKDQAIFTVWAFRRISRLQAKIIDFGAVPRKMVSKDKELAKEFSFYAAWAQFHLECLAVSMRFNKTIHPEVLETICEGLRAAVNAYGLIRQGLDLRVPPQDDPTLAPYEWTVEDQELLDSSMSGLTAVEVGEG